jgi:hypothetical protein
MHCPINVTPFTMAFNTSFPPLAALLSIETLIKYASVCGGKVVAGTPDVARIVVVHVVNCVVVPLPSLMTNVPGMVPHSIILVSVIEELTSTG